MNITLAYQQLEKLMEFAVEIGVLAAYCSDGSVRPYLKKSEAFELYGRKNVEKWIEEGLVSIQKDGDYSASLRINRLEIEIVSKAKEMSRYL